MRRKFVARMFLDGTVLGMPRKRSTSVCVRKKYRSMVNADDAKAIERIKSPGRKASLGPEALDWLRAVLNGSPLSHGYETGIWRNGDVQKLIFNQFGIYHSSGHVRTLVGKLGLEHRMRPPKQRTEKKRLTINDETLAWIAATVIESPRAHGIEADHWTNGRLRTALHQWVGVDYSRGYIWELATRAGVAELLTRRRS
jgi:transposase